MFPSVTSSKASTIQATGTVQAAIEKVVVTNADVDRAIAAVAKYKEAGKAQREAEKERDAALSGIFEKLLGIKTLDELKELSPEAVSAKLQERHDSKLFTLAPDCVAFNIDNTKDQKRPRWKEEFIAKLGEAAAKAVEQNTPTKFSYVIVKQ